MTGQIVLAATPIGNTADASMRLRELLTSADLIAAEDTRKLRSLTTRLELQVSAPVLAVHEHNERDRAEQLCQAALDGQQVLVVSDAGMPLISDPGFRIVQRAVELQVPITVAPGPSSVLTALALSGLPTDRFAFDGFLPRKAGERRSFLTGIGQEKRTIVVLEAPHRIHAALADIVEILGAQRPVALCRELTKTYEEVLRGTAGQVHGQIKDRDVKGEITLVIGAAPAAAQLSLAEVAALAVAQEQAGQRLKEATNELARSHAHPAREIYQAALELRKTSERPAD